MSRRMTMNAACATASPGDYPNPPDALLLKLDELLAQLKRASVPVNQTLWTNQDIAHWLQLSLDTVERRVITRPEFPAPLQPCQTGQRAAKRWFAGEVITWARQHRRHLPDSRPKRMRSQAA